VAYDTETTGLDTLKAEMVGMSISPAEGDAIYIPVGHKVGKNLPLQKVITIIQSAFSNMVSEVWMYNAKFDLDITENRTGWFIANYFDVMEPIYLEDPDRRGMKLKEVAKAELGIDMTKFEELFSPEEVRAKQLNIANKSPIRCCGYACADADMTRRLGMLEKFKKSRDEFPFPVKVDTKLVDIIRRVQRDGGMELRGDYIEEQIKVLRRRIVAWEAQILRMTGGGHFEINSPKQLGIVLFEQLGLPNPGMTKGKNPIYKTDKDTMENLSGNYPIVELVTQYRKLVKADKSYFEKLRFLVQNRIAPRFSFNQYAAPTFRFSAPGGEPLRDGYSGINIQAVSTGESREMMAVELVPEPQTSPMFDLDQDERLVEEVEEEEKLKKAVLKKEGKDTSKWPVNVNWTRYYMNLKTLPYVLTAEKRDKDVLVCVRETCVWCPARCEEMGIDTTRRMTKGVKVIPGVRQAFRAPEGYTLLAGDYDKQEVVIGANLSGETVWLDAMAAGKDLHAINGALAHGLPTLDGLPPEEFKKMRGDGKVCTFSIFYGATEYTLARKLNIPLPTATAIFNGFKQGLPLLNSWITKVHKFARKMGFTTTYFGRKRWLARFYKMKDRRMHSFADRSSVNTAVQGTGADITRIAMVKVDNLFKKLNLDKDQARTIMQVHDELVFMVKDDLVAWLAPQIRQAMMFHVKGWRVQLTVSMKTAKIWGIWKELKLDGMAVWILE